MVMGVVYLALLKEGIRLQRRLYRNAHPDLAAAINDLATVYIERGEHARAEVLLPAPCWSKPSEPCVRSVRRMIRSSSKPRDCSPS